MRFFTSLAVCVLFVGLASSLDKAEHCKCRIETGKRIVGGKVASSTSYPWDVSMSYGKQLSKEGRKWRPGRAKLAAHFCGGVVVNERWILTSARCVFEFKKHEDEYPLSVGVGNEHDLVQMFDEGRTYVKQIVIHPHYDKDTDANGVSLLELEEPLEFSNTVLPGCLDTQKDRKNYGDVVATGYGQTSSPLRDPDTGWPVKWGYPSRFLRELDHIDISETEEQCQESESYICVDSKSPGIGAHAESMCSGDVGGPLHKTENGRTKIIGVAKGPANHTVLDEDNRIVVCYGKTIYTRIGYYVDWIESVVGREHC